MDITEELSTLQYTDHQRNGIIVPVAREFALTVILNNREIVTLLCSPADLDYLAAGFLQ